MKEGGREGKKVAITTIKRPIKALADDPERKATLPVCRQSTFSELSFGAASRWEKNAICDVIARGRGNRDAQRMLIVRKEN